MNIDFSKYILVFCFALLFLYSQSSKKCESKQELDLGNHLKPKMHFSQRLVRKINEILFDFQMKRRFKINPKSPKICMWCGKNLSNEDKSTYGIWVSGDGNTTYDCNECSDKLKNLKEEAIEKFCIKRRWKKKESIEDCCRCYEYTPQQYYKCEELQRNVEDKYRLSVNKSQ